jgi:proteasome lid subunit RPN8/RPN11
MGASERRTQRNNKTARPQPGLPEVAPPQGDTKEVSGHVAHIHDGIHLNGNHVGVCRIWDRSYCGVRRRVARAEAVSAAVVRVPFSLHEIVRYQLCDMAKTGAPKEVCGVVYKDGQVCPFANTAADPVKGFDMEMLVDPEEVAAVYHSHPSGSPFPSVQDMAGIQQLAGSGLNWKYLIVTARDVYEYTYDVDEMAGNSL